MGAQRLIVGCEALFVPYDPEHAGLLFALDPGLPLALAAVTVSAVGYGASLLYQERLMALVPDGLSGHALGLHASGMLALQGLSAALAGAVAQATSPRTAMVVLALASLGVTLALRPQRSFVPTHSAA